MLHAFKAFLLLDLCILAFSFVIAGVSWLLGLINVDLNLTHILLALISAILSYACLKLRLAAEAAKAAAVEVKQVKETLADTHAETKKQLNGIEAVGLRTELYCNSALGRALRVAKLATAATAAKTGLPLDIAAANQAAQELADHEAKQAILDEKDAANSLPRPERQY